MPRALLQASLVIAVFAFAAACGSSTDEDSGGGVSTASDVSISLGASSLGAAAFAPDTFTLSLATKTTVRWANRDRSGTYGASGTSHHIVSNDAVFDSGVLTAGHSFSFAFDTAGTYLYHCSIHPAMVGEIIVTP